MPSNFFYMGFVCDTKETKLKTRNATGCLVKREGYGWGFTVPGIFIFFFFCFGRRNTTFFLKKLSPIYIGAMRHVDTFLFHPHFFFCHLMKEEIETTHFEHTLWF